MKKWLMLVLFSSLSFAESLDVLIKQLQTQNPLLQERREAIMIEDEKSKLSQSWDNPYLTLGVNDLLLDDITARDVEPMQTQYIMLSQKIPMGDKLALQKNIALLKRDIAHSNYHDKVDSLISKLTSHAHKVAILDKKIALIVNFQNNVKKLTRLHKKRFEVGVGTQSEIEKTKILSKKLKIKKRKFQTMKRDFLWKIEKLTFSKVAGIETSLILDKAQDINISILPIMISKNLQVQKAKQILALKQEKTTSDIKVGFGYFQREDRSDYLSLNVGMPLPLRGKEQSAIKVAMLEHKQAELSRKNLLFSLQRERDMYQSLMQDAKENHAIIKQEILPKQRYIHKLLKQEVFTKNSSITQLLENLNDSILLELEALDAVWSYFDAYAKLVYLQGGIS